jgi:hypothetical protein
MVDPVAVGGAALLALPGAWLALSGLFGIRAARTAGGLTPTPAADVAPGPATVRGAARPLPGDEAMPAPDGDGTALVYTYRVVGLPDRNSPLADGETLARGTAAVPFVVGDPGVVVAPEGAEVHLGDEAVERFAGDPPAAVADLLDDRGIAVPEGTAALAVRVLRAGDEAFVTGVVERATEDAAAEIPGRHVVRSGGGRVPFVVADDPDARGGARHVQRGAVHVVAGLLLLASAGVVAGLFGV